tara:strand:+ start:121 stop:351 length:231 start_codon:yes stop_codon:yes gene_type:complete
MTLSLDDEGDPKHMIDLINATNPRITHIKANIKTIIDVILLVSINGLDDVVVVVFGVVELVVVVVVDIIYISLHFL